VTDLSPDGRAQFGTLFIEVRSESGDLPKGSGIEALRETEEGVWLVRRTP